MIFNVDKKSKKKKQFFGNSGLSRKIKCLWKTEEFHAMTF